MPPGSSIEVFYDGRCPLCAHQMALVERLDRHGCVRFVDVADDGFDPASLGRSRAVLMERIHARTADGEVVAGVEALRRIYDAIGFHRLVAWSRWPGIGALAERVYRAVAANRYRLAGRCVSGTCSPSRPPTEPRGRHDRAHQG